MRNVCIVVILQLIICLPGTTQLVCVHCFGQNEQISSGESNLVSNGGFENTTCTAGWFADVFCPNSSLYSCDLADWTCTGGDEQSYPSVFDSTLSVIPEGDNAAYFGNGNAFTCSEMWGDTSCMTTQFCTVTGITSGYPRSNPGYGDETGVSLHQNVSGLTVGQTYVLEFWAGGEPLQGLLSAEAIFAVDVGFGKTYLTCKPTGAPGSLIGTRYLIVFDATATSHQIKFTNWGHTCIDCTELVVDDVSLYTIEELSDIVPECITATHDTEANKSVNFYPNPFSSELNIYANHSISSRIILYDIFSRQIFHQEFTRTSSINTSMLPYGTYFYIVRDENGITQSGKIIKN